MTHRLKRYLSLPAGDRAALLFACAWLAIVGVGMRIAPVRRLLPRDDAATPARGAEAAAVAPEALRRAMRCAYWLDVAARRGFPRALCLHRSLALHRWLRAQHLPSELHIGVRKANGALAAHAWVALGGHVLNDAPDAVEVFTPLTRAPHDARGLASAAAAGVRIETCLEAQ